MRGAPTVLVTVLLLVGAGLPAVAAATSASGDGSADGPTDLDGARDRFIEQVRALGLDDRQGASPTAVQIIGGDVHLRRFGDVDGDGMDDILATNWTRDGLEYAVRSGADPAEVLDRHDLEPGVWATVGEDVDGDGVRDLTVRSTGYDRTGDGDCAEVACASAYRTTVDRGFSFVTGDGFETAWDGTFTREETYARASETAPGVYGYAYAEESDGYTWLETGPAGSGSLMVVQRTETGARAFGGAVAYGSAWAEDRDLTLTMVGTDGTARGTATFDDPDRSAFPTDMFFGMRDHTGDGIPDPAVLDVRQTPASVGAGLAGTPRAALQIDVVAVSGSDASEAWRVQREPALGAPLGAWSVGDVDGEAGEELYLAEVVAAEDGTFRYRHTVMTGADGSVVASTNTSDVTLHVPFGDADGDGDDEMLRASSSDGYSFDTLAVVDDTMEPIWSVDAGDLTYLPDFEFTDWTGDGRADLAMVHGSDPRTFMVHDGPTGEIVWARTLGDDTLETAVLEDATGVGSRDLFHLVAEADDGNTTAAVDDGNFSQTRARLTLVAGETGDEIWTQTVVDPDRDGDRDLSALDLDLAGVGDVDGHGGDDVAVRIEEGYRGGEDEGTDPLERTFLLSGTTGQVHWVDPGLPADEVPEPEREEDEELGDAEPAGADPAVPAPSAGLVALAAVAALLIRRQRS